MISERNAIIFVQILAYRWKVIIWLFLKKILFLFSKVLNQIFILSMYFHLQPENIVYCVVANVMVYVSMCGKKMHRLQLVFLYVVYNCGAFLFVKGATINNDTFFGVIAYHIAVLMNRIAYKLLYI